MNGMEQAPDRREQMKSTFNVLAFIAGSLAISVEVILHRHVGERYVKSPQAAGALVILLFFSAFFPGHSSEGMWILTALFVIGIVWARVDAARRNRRGEYVHSYYTGRPGIMHRFPGGNEHRVKKFVEPVMVLVVGLLLEPVDRPLGTYLALAAVGLFVSVALIDQAEHHRELDLRDSQIENQDLMQRLRRR